MLLLDYWPLGRMRSGAGAAGERQSLSELLMEKGPLLAMSGFVCLMTLWAQREGGAVKALEEFPLHLRAANAALAYAKYLWMTVWPSPLAVFHPMPRPFPYVIAAAAAAGLVVVTVLALRLARRWPYLIVGWFCFLGTLVPVIGLVQVGQQAMADRYTYLPHVGLFMIVAFALRDVMRGRAVTVIATAAVVAACVALGALTWRQVPVWRNSVTLYSHAIAVTSDNYLAENNLGAALAKRGDVPAALPHFIRALRIRPTYESAEKNLRRALQVLSEDPRVERDELAEARQALEEAMRRRQEQE